MQTITISDAAYKTLMSRRIGSESLSTTITREMKPAIRSARDELESLRREKGVRMSQLKNEFNL